MSLHAPAGLPDSPTALEVTEIRIRPNPQSDNILKAYVSITLNDCLAVHNVKIIDGKRGLFVSMPARADKRGRHCDIVHPVNQAFRRYLEAVVIGEYERRRGGEAGGDW